MSPHFRPGPWEAPLSRQQDRTSSQLGQGAGVHPGAGARRRSASTPCFGASGRRAPAAGREGVGVGHRGPRAPGVQPGHLGGSPAARGAQVKGYAGRGGRLAPGGHVMLRPNDRAGAAGAAAAGAAEPPVSPPAAAGGAPSHGRRDPAAAAAAGRTVPARGEDRAPSCGAGLGGILSPTPPAAYFFISFRPGGGDPQFDCSGQVSSSRRGTERGRIQDRGRVEDLDQVPPKWARQVGPAWHRIWCRKHFCC